jgi:hypothetical protein
MTTKIFCDDAGFTGDNLLHLDQPYFGYAAVAIEPAEAKALVAALRGRFGLIGSELKGRVLYRRPDALSLITWLLDELGERAVVAVSDKLFSLAAKFFEYVFEPVLARNSLFLYERGFHLHVANVLWAHLTHGETTSAKLASRFEEMLRRRGGEPQSYFAQGGAGGSEGAIATIERFIVACRPEIEAELASLADETGRIQWVLDLSFSSAKSVLCTMGERFGALDVTFDESKPLAAYRHFFDGFVGRSEIARLKFRGRDAAMTFNLAKPVEFGSSAAEPGLQLADIVASFSALAARDRRTDRGNQILTACLPYFDDDSVWPDLEHLRIDKKENFLNAILLIELATRAEAGEDLLDNLEEYYELISWRFDVDPPAGFLSAQP